MQRILRCRHVLVRLGSLELGSLYRIRLDILCVNASPTSSQSGIPTVRHSTAVAATARPSTAATITTAAALATAVAILTGGSSDAARVATLALAALASALAARRGTGAAGIKVLHLHIAIVTGSWALEQPCNGIERLG